MSLRKAFIVAFIFSCIALTFFMVVHLLSIRHFFEVAMQLDGGDAGMPFRVFSGMFTPQWVLGAVLATLSSLVYRILGIVMVAKMPRIDSTERMLFIFGFILFAFATAIVFLAMKKGIHYEEQMKEAAVVT